MPREQGGEVGRGGREKRRWEEARVKEREQGDNGGEGEERRRQRGRRSINE